LPELRKFFAPGNLLGVAPMSHAAEPMSTEFVDRRSYESNAPVSGRERRQFANSHQELSPAARELALAVDQYKLAHRRRFVTYEELLEVVQSLGYQQ
jgi:hypothetical protein